MPEAEPEPEGVAIGCALDGAETFEEVCAIEVVRGDGGVEYVLHRPDGGFRRVDVGPDGLYRALDGADSVSETQTGEATLLTIDGDVFAIPLSDEPLGMYD